jgi:hypothetical protein
MSHDDPDDITYNPFAEERDYSPATSKLVTTHSGHYSSSFVPKSATSRPSLRFRRKGSADQAYISDPEDNKKHARTRSDSPKSAGLHPLKSALAGLNGAVFPDLGITRPHLSRLVSDSNVADDIPESSTNGKSQSQPSPAQETDVIVHHVRRHTTQSAFNLNAVVALGHSQGLISRCLFEIWNITCKPPESKPTLDLRYHTSSRCTLYTHRSSEPRTRVYTTVSSHHFHPRRPGGINRPIYNRHVAANAGTR